MPAPAIQPDSVHEIAFRALAASLKADPDLRRVVRPASFRDLCGRPAEMAEPTAADCPWVRLTPVALDARRDSYGSEYAPLRVLVQTAVAGPDSRAAANLWGLIAAAIRSDAVDGAVLDAGASDLVIERPALPGRTEDYSEVTRAEGSLRLDIYLAD